MLKLSSKNYYIFFGLTVTLLVHLSLGMTSKSPASVFLLPGIGESQAAALTFHVDPNTGSDSNSGVQGSPFRTLQKALTLVQPGMTIRLASGIYQEANQTVTAGTAAAPIVIEPEPGATPIFDGKANTLNAIFVLHSYYTIRNLEFRNTKEGVRLEGVTGVILENSVIHHVANEGLRLRHFATRNTIRNNKIYSCGLTSNGEGIYIGTAPEQRYKNGGLPDTSSYNLISGNELYDVFEEGIDVKEDSSFNTIENNLVHHAKGPQSGAIAIRSDQNYLYGNLARDNAGAGYRFGGDVTYCPIHGDNYHYSVDNLLRNNVASSNAGHAYKFMNGPQDADTSNTGSGNGGLVYYYGSGVQPFVASGGASATATPTRTPTATPPSVATATSTAVPTATSTATATPTSLPTATSTATATATAVPAPATATATPGSVPTTTATAAATASPTATLGATSTPTATRTPVQPALSATATLTPAPVTGGGGGGGGGGGLPPTAAPTKTHTPTPSATATPSPTATSTPTATATAQPRATIRLSKGWNLVSAPSRPANPSFMAVFGGIADKVYRFNSSSGGWDYAVAAGPQWLGNLTDVEEGQGYWVNSLADGSVILDLLPKEAVASPPAQTLVSGWNVIGYTSRDLAPSTSVATYLASLKAGWTSLFRYSPGIGFELAKPDFGFSDLELGRGYFIYLDSAGVLQP